MPYQVSRFGPQTWALALKHEHWYEQTRTNRSTSRISLEKVVNNSLATGSRCVLASEVMKWLVFLVENGVCFSEVASGGA